MRRERRHLENKELRRLIMAGQLMALELRRLNGELPRGSKSKTPTPGLTDTWDASLTSFHQKQEDMLSPLRPIATSRGVSERNGGTLR